MRMKDAVDDLTDEVRRERLEIYVRGSARRRLRGHVKRLALRSLRPQPCRPLEAQMAMRVIVASFSSPVGAALASGDVTNPKRRSRD